MLLTYRWRASALDLLDPMRKRCVCVWSTLILFLLCVWLKRYRLTREEEAQYMWMHVKARDRILKKESWFYSKTMWWIHRKLPVTVKIPLVANNPTMQCGLFYRCRNAVVHHNNCQWWHKMKMINASKICLRHIIECKDRPFFQDQCWLLVNKVTDNWYFVFAVKVKILGSNFILN